MKQLIGFATSTLLLVAALCTPARASIVSYDVLLSAAQAIPGNGSPAVGSATVTVDDALNTVFVNLTFSGLIGGSAIAAHIHCCSAPTGTAPVVIQFTGFPNATSGSYASLLPGVSAASIAGIEAGLAYLDIHTAMFPAGEIRGNIGTRVAAVPEPGVIALFGLGLAALAGLRRERRPMRS